MTMVTETQWNTVTLGHHKSLKHCALWYILYVRCDGQLDEAAYLIIVTLESSMKVLFRRAKNLIQQTENRSPP